MATTKAISQSAAASSAAPQEQAVVKKDAQPKVVINPSYKVQEFKLTFGEKAAGFINGLGYYPVSGQLVGAVRLAAHVVIAAFFAVAAFFAGFVFCNPEKQESYLNSYKAQGQGMKRALAEISFCASSCYKESDKKMLAAKEKAFYLAQHKPHFQKVMAEISSNVKASPVNKTAFNNVLAELALHTRKGQVRAAASDALPANVLEQLGKAKDGVLNSIASFVADAPEDNILPSDVARNRLVAQAAKEFPASQIKKMSREDREQFLEGIKDQIVYTGKVVLPAEILASKEDAEDALDDAEIANFYEAIAERTRAAKEYVQNAPKGWIPALRYRLEGPVMRESLVQSLAEKARKAPTEFEGKSYAGAMMKRGRSLYPERSSVVDEQHHRDTIQRAMYHAGVVVKDENGQEQTVNGFIIPNDAELTAPVPYRQDNPSLFSSESAPMARVDRKLSQSNLEAERELASIRSSSSSSQPAATDGPARNYASEMSLGGATSVPREGKRESKWPASHSS
jgi:hypothetical protein